MNHEDFRALDTGRTLPTGVSTELALLMIREAYSAAEYCLNTLDKQRGL
jgi:hypothetical protein